MIGNTGRRTTTACLQVEEDAQLMLDSLLMQGTVEHLKFLRWADRQYGMGLLRARAATNYLRDNGMVKIVPQPGGFSYLEVM